MPVINSNGSQGRSKTPGNPIVCQPLFPKMRPTAVFNDRHLTQQLPRPEMAVVSESVARARVEKGQMPGWLAIRNEFLGNNGNRAVKDTGHLATRSLSGRSIGVEIFDHGQRYRGRGRRSRGCCSRASSERAVPPPEYPARGYMNIHLIN